MAALSSSSKKIKFLYSYGGKFKLSENGEYVGGTNKIVTVDRRITYTELIVKLWDVGGPSMSLMCKLPTNDFYSFVHVTSDKDLAYVIEKYDRTRKNFKIRTILDPLPQLLDGYFGDNKDKVEVFSFKVTRSNLSCRPSNGQRR